MRDIINTDEFVALPWSDEDDTVGGVLAGETGGWFIREDFNELFEVVGKFLGESRESYYQGLSFTAVIKRKSDGKLFGHTYWEDISKYGEAYYEANGDKFGLEDYDEDDEYFNGWIVFAPVKKFTVTGYESI